VEERNYMKKIALTLALTLLVSVTAWPQSSQVGQTSKLLLRQPTLNKTHIVFVYAGDLWIVGREGGEAARLTTDVGGETGPLFSPDGSKVAFTGQYDGNVDVYVVPVTGGVPKRLTYHPAQDFVVNWSLDGKNILFGSTRSSESGRTAQLFTMPLDGVFPTLVSLPMATSGSYSPDGARLAYEPVPRAFNAWKRYRGGRASYIWLANLSDSSVEKLPRTDSNDFNPMWIGNKIYFLSDRNGPTTLFAYDTATKRVTELLKNDGLDIKSATAGPDAIVYEQFGSLNLFDLKTNKARRLDITIKGDMQGVRARYEKVGNRISNYALSPTGARAIFEARGEIITVPAEKGDVRNLTNTQGVAERRPAWSPDGKWIAYFSDEAGEYELYLRAQSGQGEVKKIKLAPSFYYAPIWSPDSKKIAFSDKRLNLWYVDIEKGTPVKVETARRSLGGGSNFNHTWSPDSRWIAYTNQLPSWYNAVFIYSLEDGKSTQITDGLSDAASTVFDKNGKYLYFTASTDIGPAVFGFDMTSYPHRPTRNVYVAVLRKDLPSPLAPESDEEKVAEEKKDEPKKEGEAAKPDAAAKPGEKKEPPKVAIDFDGIGQRILALPVPTRSYAGIAVGKAGTLFIGENAQAPGQQGFILHKYDLEKRKLDKVAEGLSALDFSANGEKMLYRQGQSWFIASTAQPIKPGEGKIKTEDMEVYVDPKVEWQQMYRETWRIERDFFYDPNLHGLDWQAMSKKYEPYLGTLEHRDDLNYLFNEMLGELSVGHLYVQGGDSPNPKFVPGGLLGADYKIENGRYRFAKVYDGENWNPQLRAPLTQPASMLSRASICWPSMVVT
jgi:tricorn protease